MDVRVSSDVDGTPPTQVLEARFWKLAANLKGKTDKSDVKEVSELEALIPEIKDKITDTNKMKA